MNKKENLLLEDLARLYLRLNGFWVQNFIVHSHIHGDLSSELDILGIRFPFHKQTDRKVESSSELEISKNRIQIIIGDSKNYTNKSDLKFNDGLRLKEDSIVKLINWIGISENKPDNELVSKFKYFLNIHEDKGYTGIPTLIHDSILGNFDIKFLFFCPSLNKWDGNGFKYIHGEEMMMFVWTCLNKLKVNKDCSKSYSYESWNQYEQIVRYFKKTQYPTNISDYIKGNSL